MFYSKKLKTFKKIQHCFFSKKGGFSTGFYKALNCGRGSKDSKKNISRNLDFVSNKMRVNKNQLILMNQSHSTRVLEINKKNFRKEINSDAVITKEKGLALAVLTADCVPILVYDFKNEIVGCIHAGWRGAFSGIIKNTILKMRKTNKDNLIYASIGPCIGKKNYEVDIKFFYKFLSKSKKNIKYFSKKSKHKKLFNLRKFVNDKLLELKVIVDHVNYDTFEEKNNFFSYRRSLLLNQKDYGRCISVIKMI